MAARVRACSTCCTRLVPARCCQFSKQTTHTLSTNEFFLYTERVLGTGRRTMKAIVATDQAAGTAPSPRHVVVHATKSVHRDPDAVGIAVDPRARLSRDQGRRYFSRIWPRRGGPYPRVGRSGFSALAPPSFRLDRGLRDTAGGADRRWLFQRSRPEQQPDCASDRASDEGPEEVDPDLAEVEVEEDRVE